MKRLPFLLCLFLLFVTWGFCGYLLLQQRQFSSQSRSPQSGDYSESIIKNKTYNDTYGAYQGIVIGRGATSPQSGTYSPAQIENKVYNDTYGGYQLYLSSDSSDIPFINNTAVLDGDLLYYNGTSEEFETTQGQITIEAIGSQLALPLEADASTPTLSFGDDDSGIYESTDDQLRFATAGIARWYMSGNIFGGIATNGSALYNGTGSASLPNFTIVSDTDTGIFLPTGNKISFATNGTERMTFDSTGEAEFSYGIVPVSKTSDPCGSGFPTGAIFYNSTANTWCGCDGTNDVKLVDGSACF